MYEAQSKRDRMARAALAARWKHSNLAPDFDAMNHSAKESWYAVVDAVLDEMKQITPPMAAAGAVEINRLSGAAAAPDIATSVMSAMIARIDPRDPRSFGCGAAPDARCDIKDCTEVAVANLDDENLCQGHADRWARGEGAAAYVAELEEGQAHEPV